MTNGANDLLLHPLTKRQIEVFLASPSHALMLTGPEGSGKGTLAIAVAAGILSIPIKGFIDYPYTLLITSKDGKAIGIEAVRQLEQFLSLKVPGQHKAAHDRVVVIENAHALTIEAQNALLKMLEEPPKGTVLILTASFQQAILPTIRSRAQAIAVNRLDREELMSHFTKQGADEADITQAYAISGGLPGRMYALLHETDHPLLTATAQARQLLSQPAFERLTMVDELAKQRPLALDVTAILQQMAHISLQTAQGAAAKKWQQVLRASYDAHEALSVNAQPKLALTKLMLSL